jgi:DNA-binding NtrC family response regulator
MEKRKSKILVVDDEISIALLIKDFLILRGYDVSIAMNGNEGLRLFKDERPQVVILDMRMPGIQGDKLKTIMKEIDNKTQVILTSGHLDVEDLCKDSDDLFLKKPFKMHDLMNAIKEAEKRLAY